VTPRDDAAAALDADVATASDRWAVGARLAFVSHLDFNLYRFRLEIMRHLVSAGAEVFAVVPTGEYDGRWAHAGIRHVPYGTTRRSLSPLAAAGTVRELRKAFATLRPDLVHTFTLRPNLLGTAAARMAGVPRIVNSVTGRGTTLGTHGAPEGIRGVALRAFVRLASRRAHAVVFQNEADRTYFLRHRLVADDRSWLVAGSGVDLETFSRRSVSPAAAAAVRAELGIPATDLVVVMVARLIRPKGVLEFAEASRLVRRARPDVTFLLIGEPDPGNPLTLEALDLEWLRETAGLRLAGRRSDVPTLLAAADVFALPSYYGEGVPRSTLEAMAMELPVVTCDGPGCRDTVVPDRNGILIPARDAGALAHAVLTLAADPARRRSMATESRRLATDRFGVDRVVSQHMDIYQTLFAAPHG
jgi:N,N'-diacetylbacillosaminyl-diphospho-undecaprenol alpha-1,3-N-acetylgalactosaminyltransferase